MSKMLEKDNKNYYNKDITQQNIHETLDKTNAQYTKKTEKTKETTEKKELKQIFEKYLCELKKSINNKDKDIEKRLKNAFKEQDSIKRTPNSLENSIKNLNVSDAKFSARPPYVQQAVLYIEQQVWDMIRSADKDPNIIARILGKIMQKII